MLPTKFQVNGPFGSGEEKKKKDFGFRSKQFWLFLIYKSPQYFLPSNGKSVGLLIQKKQTIYFQDGGQGGHLVFSSGTILAILSYKSP